MVYMPTVHLENMDGGVLVCCICSQYEFLQLSGLWHKIPQARLLFLRLSLILCELNKTYGFRAIRFFQDGVFDECVFFYTLVAIGWSRQPHGLLRCRRPEFEFLQPYLWFSIWRKIKRKQKNYTTLMEGSKPYTAKKGFLPYSILSCFPIQISINS